MKHVAKNILRKLLTMIDNNRPMNDTVDIIGRKTTCVEKGTQMLLSLKYKELLAEDVPLPSFEDVEFSSFSQNGEDGILFYIFSLIGTASRRCIEICAGDGIECNSANLVLNSGWEALLFDNDISKVRRGQQFYLKCKETSLWPPIFVNAWITAENVNSFITSNGFEGEIDLLSLDIDGMDYWIWKSIDCIVPRVVVVEYNNLWGPDKAVTVPYKPDFVADDSDYRGASLAALVGLGREKGYRLVGCQRYGFNAFFIRSGIAEDIFPEIASSQCFGHPFAQSAMKNRLSRILDRDWIQV